MTRKKSNAQLEREIAQALTRHATKKVTFTDLIRDDDPAAMHVAEDFLLERGWKLREVTGALAARNFTIEMKPLYGPAGQWKMVQVNVDKAGAAFPGRMWVKYSIANGPVRITREEEYATSPEAARKGAVATAWAIAKAIKPLPLDTDKRTIERVADEVIDDGLDNLYYNEELF